VLGARNAVVTAFVLNGLLFATLYARVPDLRSDLDLSNGGLGLLLLAAAAGSVIALPSSGFLIRRSSAGAVVRAGAALCAAGLVVTALGTAVLSVVPVAAVGLFAYGVGTGIWDVSMNVEGAEVERGLGRSIMPRFHAAWSVGSIVGAGIGVAVTAAGLPMIAHFTVLGFVGLAAALRGTRAFLPAEDHPAEDSTPGSAWLEPRTLAIGLMLLCFAIVEGSANDWLSLALIDGYDAPHWVGVGGFAVFVTAMTVGRVAGPLLLDRFGRAPVLWVTAATAATGIVLLVLGDHPVLAGIGIVIWGLGASLGFPVGMSAAADDPARAAARVSVVSTIGYGAFLAGPPLLGVLGDRIGTLESLLAVAVLMAPAMLAVFAARPARPAQPAQSARSASV
jgi:fucose permease